MTGRHRRATPLLALFATAVYLVGGVAYLVWPVRWIWVVGVMGGTALFGIVLAKSSRARDERDGPVADFADGPFWPPH